MKKALTVTTIVAALLAWSVAMESASPEAVHARRNLHTATSPSGFESDQLMKRIVKPIL
jgi:hypothetical protein